MSESIDIIVKKEAREELKGLVSDLEKADLQLIEATKSAVAFSNAFKGIKLPSEFNTAIKQSATISGELNTKLIEQEAINKKLQTQINRLTQTRQKANQKTAVEINNQKVLTRNVREYGKINSKLSTEYEKQGAILVQLRRDYKHLAIQQELGNKLTKSQVREMKKLEREANKIDRALKKVDKAVGQSQRNVGNYSSALKGLKGTFTALMGAFGVASAITIFAQLVRGAIASVIEFDRQLIAVGKTADLSGDDLKKFGKEAINLGLKLRGISIQNLLKTAEVAGQLGIRGSENILKFAETMEKLRLTSDVAGQEAALSFAKFIELSSDSVENADRLGSVITELGNNFATTESKILKNTTEIQKGLNIYKTSAQSVIALGAATNALGSEAEASRGALQTTFKTLNEAATSGKNLQKILELTGQTQAEFKKEFGEDSVRTFQRFIKGLSDSAKEGKNLSSLLTELGLDQKRVEAVVGSLAINYNVLEDALNSANKEYEANKALNREVDAATESLQSQLGDLKDSWDGLIFAIETGDGVISRALMTIVRDLSKLFLTLNFLLEENGTWLERVKVLANGVSKAMNFLAPAMFLLPDLFEESTNKILLNTEALEDSTKAITKENEAFIEQNKSLAPLLESQQKLIDNQNKINKLFGGETDESGITTLKTLRAELKKLKDELEEIDITDQKAIKTKKESIAEIKQKIDAIVGLKKSTEDLKKVVKGSIKDYQKQIAVLKDLRDRTASTSLEYRIFTDDIEKLQREIDLLTKSYDVQKTAIDKLHDATARLVDVKAELAEQTHAERQEGGLAAEILSASDAFQLYGQQAVNAINLIGDAQQARSDNQLQNLEIEKERALEYAGDNAEARERIEKEFDKKRKQILQKQAKTDKAVAISSSVMNTALAVVKALPNIPLSVIVGILGAAQTAIIASTPIPQFKDGHLAGTHEGWALINDIRGGNYKEIVERKGGGIEMHDERNKLIHMQKGDKVHKAGTFTPSPKSLLRDSIMFSVINEQQILSKSQSQQVINENTQKSILEELKEIKKGTKIKPNIIVKSATIDYAKLGKAIALENKTNKI